MATIDELRERGGDLFTSRTAAARARMAEPGRFSWFDAADATAAVPALADLVATADTAGHPGHHEEDEAVGGWAALPVLADGDAADGAGACACAACRGAVATRPSLSSTCDPSGNRETARSRPRTASES